MTAAGLDLADAEVAELTEHTEGWSAGLYLAALSAKASGARDQGRDRVPGGRPFLGRLSPLGAPLAPAARRAALPDPDLRSRAHVGPALRRRARVERLGGDAGVARALQPVPGAAGPHRRVVSLPPSLPGAAAFGARASRAGSRAAAARSCGRLVRGERAAGGRDRVRAGGRRRQPDRATDRAELSRHVQQRPCRDRRTLARLAGRARGNRDERGGRRDRRTDRRALGPAGGGGALGRCRRTRELRRHALRRQRFDRLVAGPHACAALSARGREDAHRCGARGRDARPWEPVQTERHGAARDFALAGRRDRPGRRPVRRRRRGGARVGGVGPR